jgi:cobalamin biosynthesis protein CobD/CbiB
LGVAGTLHLLALSPTQPSPLSLSLSHSPHLGWLAQGRADISLIFVVHAALSLMAYATQHVGPAVAAMVMNLPLLWLTLGVKQVDDELYHVVRPLVLERAG